MIQKNHVEGSLGLQRTKQVLPFFFLLSEHVSNMYQFILVNNNHLFYYYNFCFTTKNCGSLRRFSRIACEQHTDFKSLKTTNKKNSDLYFCLVNVYQLLLVNQNHWFVFHYRKSWFTSSFQVACEQHTDFISLKFNEQRNGSDNIFFNLVNMYQLLLFNKNQLFCYYYFFSLQKICRLLGRCRLPVEQYTEFKLFLPYIYLWHLFVFIRNRLAFLYPVCDKNITSTAR